VHAVDCRSFPEVYREAGPIDILPDPLRAFIIVIDVFKVCRALSGRLRHTFADGKVYCRKVRRCFLDVEVCFHPGVFQLDLAAIGHDNVVVNADVAAADGRQPVPAHGCMHGRVVLSEFAAIGKRPLRQSLGRDEPGCPIPVNQDGKVVAAAVIGQCRDVEFCADESALDGMCVSRQAICQPLPVEPHVGFPVDGVKIQKDSFVPMRYWDIK